ncbi:MAG: hypothetical protein NXI09_08560 [Bacteroidetes bacterium]|nr:hypothetical protein [Bacteroidota bacterium]
MAKILKKLKRLNPLAKGMLLFVVAAFGLSFLFAPEQKPVDYRELSFKTTSDSRIYFNNMRSFFYKIDRFSKRPMEIYRLKRRSPERDSIGINFSIAHYPGAESAYIVCEIGAAYEHCDSLSVKFSKYPDSEQLKLMNGEQQFKLAAKVYSSLLEEEAIFLCCASDTLIQLYMDKSSQLDAEVVLEDYFRLTQKN